MPCSKKDLFSACALYALGISYILVGVEAPRRQRLPFAALSPTKPRTTSGKDRRTVILVVVGGGGGDGDYDDDADSEMTLLLTACLPQDKRKTGRQESHKRLKEGFR